MPELLVLNMVKREITAVSLDGTGARTLVDGLDELPDGIVVDQQRGHIYWTNMGTPDPGADIPYELDDYSRNGSIERVNFDGTDRRRIVPVGAFTTGKQITADFGEGKLYWCDREGMQVLRCNLDGSELEPLVIVATGDEAAHDPLNHCVGIAVDPARRQVYWTQKGASNSGHGRIFRAGIDIPAGKTAADRDDIELLWDDLPEPIDLHLDPNGILVWTDRGDPPTGNTLNRAFVQPDLGTIQICSRDYKEAVGVDTDGEGIYYVGELYGGGIRVVNLADGTDRELVNLGPGLTGIALAEL